MVSLNPWQFVSRQLTAWLLPYIDYELDDHGKSCDCCRAKPDTWPTPGKAVSYVDSYQRSLVICEDCITLYLSNSDVMGVEAIRKGDHPVPNKFGMLASVRVVADQSGVIMFAPQKISDKLPKNFPISVHTYKSLAEADFVMAQTEWKYPAVFISDLGKKKGEMIEKLAYSYSSRRVNFCSADQIEVLNFDAINTCLSLASTMEKSLLSKAIKLMYATANGKLSPAELFGEVKDSPEIKALLTAATPDPALRIIIGRFLKNV